MTYEEVVRDLQTIADYFTEQSGGAVPISLEEAIKIISKIVCCKDCKWYEQKQKNLPYAVKKRYCNRSCTLATKEDDFCSYGERMEK